MGCLTAKAEQKRGKRALSGDAKHSKPTPSLATHTGVTLMDMLGRVHGRLFLAFTQQSTLSLGTSLPWGRAQSQYTAVYTPLVLVHRRARLVHQHITGIL